MEQNIESENANQSAINLGRKIPSWLGFVIIAVVVVILFGGVFAYQYFNQYPFSTGPLITDQTAGWKTYTNNGCGIEFRYPESFSISKEYIKDYCDIQFNGEAYPQFGVFVNLPTGFEFTTDYKPTEDFVVDGNKIKIWHPTAGGTRVGTYASIVTFSKNGNSYGIWSWQKIGSRIIEEAQDQLFRSILSGFKLTIANQTAGWETYTNTEYGFEFKYPYGYSFKIFKDYRNSDLSFLLNGPNGEDIRIDREIDDTDYASWSFEKFTLMRTKCASQFSGCQDVDKETKFINPNGVSGYEIYYNESYDNGTTGVRGPMYMLDFSPLKNSYIRGILVESLRYNSTSNKFDPLSDKEIMDKIVSTFKFTTSSDQTAGWKTYTNTEYGFEFKYPLSLKVDVIGPNIVQQDLNAGKTISGTETPSYKTIYFRDSTNKAKFQIGVFHVTDKVLSEDNYKNYFYTSGICDLRYLNAQSLIKIIQDNGISFIQVDAIGAGNLPLSCFYSKNKNGNLIVISMLAPDNKSDYDAMMNIIEGALSTFKFTK